MSYFLNDICTLNDGWLRVSRQGLSSIAEVVNEKSAFKNEFWSCKPVASILIRVPDKQITKSLYVTLNLRAVFSKKGYNSQKVIVKINNFVIETFEVSSRHAYTKLMVIPCHKIFEPCKIFLEFPDATIEQDELVGVPVDAVISVELSSAALFASLDEYLTSVQNEYDAACEIRNNLLSHDLNELTDRGELLDTAQITLNFLKEKPSTYQNICSKLNNFINDPYVRAKQDTRIAFDKKYYDEFYESLKEGHIHQEIRDWVHQLEAFNRAIIDLGNKEFSLPGFNLKKDDPFIRRLSDLVISQDKLLVLKERNARLNHLEILLQKATLSSIPPSLEIEMTSACNYNCVMCGRSYHSFQLTAQNDHKLYQLLSVLPYIKHVTVAGIGENTMSDRLVVLAWMLQKFDCDSRIFTNASLIHRQLDALSLFKRVCISFDGAKAETFETQRRGSKFKRVIRNIKMLRHSAPNITIAFSVVVSRLNLDEIPDIIRIGGKLGINIIALSPVEHIPELLLQKSDLPLFKTVLKESLSIASDVGITLENNIGEENFTACGDSPRDKLKLLQHFQTLTLSGVTTKRKQELIAEFEQLNFSYHPSKNIHPNHKWPDIPKMVDLTKTATLQETEDFRFDFDIDLEIARINAEIERLTDQINFENKSVIIPYCLSIWNYSYLKANGKARLCPQRNVDAGNILYHGIKSTINSDTNKAYRSSMFEVKKLHEHCKVCLDPYRHWDIQNMLKVCEDLDINPPNLSSLIL